MEVDSFGNGSYAMDTFIGQNNTTVINNGSHMYHNCPVYTTDLLTQVLKTIAYAAIFLGSIIGNILVIYVVYVNKKMHTVTNHLIVNMAAADLLITVVCMPMTVADTYTHRVWVLGKQGEIICKLTPFLQGVSVASSVFSLTAIAVDRFLNVVIPLKKLFTLQIANVVILLIWVASVAIMAPAIVVNKVSEYQDGQLYCYETWEEPFDAMKSPQNYTFALFVLLYVLPLAAMAILYTIVAKRLWLHKRPGNQVQCKRRHRATMSKIKVVKMLITVVTTFMLCWLPLHLVQFITSYADLTCDIPPVFVFFAFFLGHGNSAANPAIYVLFNSQFRDGFKVAFLRLICRKTSSLPSSMQTAQSL